MRIGLRIEESYVVLTDKIIEMLAEEKFLRDELTPTDIVAMVNIERNTENEREIYRKRKRDF